MLDEVTHIQNTLKWQPKKDFYVFDCFGNCDYFEALEEEEEKVNQ